VTCIVALKNRGHVWMGADSAGVGGYSLVQRRDPKIYRVGPMLIGFTTSFRMGQLLAYGLTIPDHHAGVPAERYFATVFIDAVRACLKAGGWATKKEENEIGGTFLVAYRSRIFRIDCDYQVGESMHEYDAVGCGSDLALGALFASRGSQPTARIRQALQAAEVFSSGVRAPFIVERL
jgi:ATP-dependent protease HslVU (ClpYQ) peptidase subunit